MQPQGYKPSYDTILHCVSCKPSVHLLPLNSVQELQSQWNFEHKRNGLELRRKTMETCGTSEWLKEGAGKKGSFQSGGSKAGHKGWTQLKEVKEIHGRMMESGKEFEVSETNSLMDMYVKCGSVEDARSVFDKMRQRSVVSWNIMILGYAKEEQGALALELYAQMQQEGFEPSKPTFLAALKACSSLAAVEEWREEGEGEGKVVKLGCLEKGRAIHSQLLTTAFMSDVFIGTTLVDMYAKCGSMEDARRVFHKLPHRDAVSWNTMILGYAEKDKGEVAMELYERMQQENVGPTERTFLGALKACSSLAALEEWTKVDGRFVKRRWLGKGRTIHSKLVKSGFESDVFLGTALVNMYVKCGSIENARQVFDKLRHRDVVLWNALIAGYAGEEESGEAFKLFSQMQEQGVSADRLTFVSIFKACGNTAALEAGKKFHAQICRLGLETNPMVATALIDMYGKCGSMFEAQQVFDSLTTRDVVTWSSLIAGYARQGQPQLVIHSFDKMREEGIQPNGVTFLGVLTVCSHAGLVDKGQRYFEAMSQQHGITPTIEHYTCMVDLLGRAGQLDEAVNVVEQMPFQPNLVAWRTVLGACQKWNNVEAGRRAFECAVRLDDTDAAAYVLMSNIYADAHMWEDSDHLQAARKNVQAWKMQGQSWWADSGGTVHTFGVGDRKHAHSKDISAKLKDLYVKMEEEGYVPDLDSVLWDMSHDQKQDALCGHSEKLAIAYALLNTPVGTTIRIAKNLRVCNDCHKAIAVISKIEHRNIVCRDANRFHSYKDGTCSCGDYW